MYINNSYHTIEQYIEQVVLNHMRHSHEQQPRVENERQHMIDNGKEHCVNETIKPNIQRRKKV